MRMGRVTLMLIMVVSLIVLVFPAQTQTNMQVMEMGNRLRLRSAPTTDSTTRQYLNAGEELLVLNRSADGIWTEVQLVSTGLTGWVASDFIEPIPGDNVPASAFTFADIEVNGVTVISNVNQNAINIFRRGQTMGNRANVFTKVGDSITFTPWFLDPIGDGQYDLAGYDYLQDAVNYFSTEVAREENSFKHNSVAMASGWNASLMLNPEYANPSLCQAGETPLECEYRITRPSIALIMFGTNDVGFMSGFVFRQNMEWIVETSINNGVIPVISTIPNRLDRQEEVRGYNGIIKSIAYKYNVPLWDYGAVMDTLPGQGLAGDGVHPNSSPSGTIGQADFAEPNLQYGFPMRNMTALQALNSILQQVILRV